MTILQSRTTKAGMCVVLALTLVAGAGNELLNDHNGYGLRCSCGPRYLKALS